MSIKQVQTSIAKISIERDSIVLVELIENTYSTHETLEENTLAILKLSGEQGGDLVIFDIQNLKGVSKEARSLAKSMRYNFVYKAVGIVVGNLLTRMFASFFVGISRPGFPIKIFNCKKDAHVWLLKINSELKQSNSPKLDS
jgi:hypothetical protein